jgi:four helix bundle protein
MAVSQLKELVAWQKSIDLVEEVYGLTKFYPRTQLFSLTNQTERSAVSVASNIAEGFGRGSPQDFLRFCYIARGSLFELDTQLLIASRLKYLAPENFQTMKGLIDELSKVLAGLIRSLVRQCS